MFGTLLGIIESIELVQSASCLQWLIVLIYKVTQPEQSKTLTTTCITLLTKIADELAKRANPYHLILRSRYGLYGTPLEPELFDVEPPAPSKASPPAPLSYAAVVAGDSSNTPTSEVHNHFAYNKEHLDPKDILSSTYNDSKVKLKNVAPLKLAKGLLETEPLHFTCVSSSDGTRVEKADVNTNSFISNIVPISVSQVQNSGTKKVEIDHYVHDFINDGVCPTNKTEFAVSLSNDQDSNSNGNSAMDNVYQMIIHSDNIKNEDFAKLSNICKFVN